MGQGSPAGHREQERDAGLWSRIFRKRNRAPEARDPSSPILTLSVPFSAARAEQSDHSDRQPTRSGSLSAEKERTLLRMSPWNHQALVSLRGDLKLRVQMETGLGDKLEKVAGGFMDEHEAQTVREQPGNKKQMDKVIEILLGKGDKEFNAFLKILRNSNNEVWAEELKNAANRFKRVKGHKDEADGGSTHRCQCLCI